MVATGWLGLHGYAGETKRIRRCEALVDSWERSSDSLWSREKSPHVVNVRRGSLTTNERVKRQQEEVVVRLIKNLTPSDLVSEREKERNEAPDCSRKAFVVRTHGVWS